MLVNQKSRLVQGGFGDIDMVYAVSQVGVDAGSDADGSKVGKEVSADRNVTWSSLKG